MFRCQRFFISTFFILFFATWGSFAQAEEIMSIQQEKNSSPLILSQHEAVSLFIENNYTVAIDRYNVAKAGAGYIQAGAYPNPNLYVNNTQLEFVNGQISDANLVRAIGVSQLFRLGGKRELSMESASETASATLYGHKDNIRTLLLSFIPLYYQCVIDKAAMDQGKADLDYFNKIMEITETRKKIGSISDLEYLGAIAQQLTYSGAYQNAVTQYSNDIRSLKTALRLGDEREVDVLPEESIDQLLSYQPDLQQMKQASLNRYSILALKKQIGADRLNLNYQNSQNVPDIGAAVEYDTVGTDVNGRRLPSLFGINFNLNIPIFDRNVGGVSTAEYTLKQDELALANATTTANTEVEQAYNNFVTSQSIFKEYYARQPEIERMHEKIKGTYVSGSLLYLINFEHTYKLFRDSYRTAFYNLMLKKALLDLYVGGIKI